MSDLEYTLFLTAINETGLQSYFTYFELMADQIAEESTFAHTRIPNK